MAYGWAGAILIFCGAWLAEPAESPSADAERVQKALEAAAQHLADGRPEEALAELAPVEAAEPENPWLWFYRGTAHQQIGRPYLAMEAYDRALDILASLGDPDPVLAKNIELYRAQARRQVFSFSLQTGLAYDTNVTYLGKGAVGQNLISGQADGRFASEFRLSYSPIANEKEAVTAGAWLSHAWHFSVEEFDYQDYGGLLRYRRALGGPWSLSLQYEYDQIYLGRDSFLSNHRLTPALIYQWARPTGRLRPEETTIYYRFDAQDFLFDTEPAFDRDGFVHAAGLEQTFLFQPFADKSWTWGLSAGYLFESVATEGTEFDRLDHVFHAGVRIPLLHPADPSRYLIIPDKPLVFHFDAQWEIDDYRHASLLDEDGDERSDLLTTLGWALSQTLLDDPKAGILILDGIISWTDAESNVTLRSTERRAEWISPFTYDKVVYGVQLRWSW